MPVKEFWDDVPELLWTYRKSYMDELRLQRELDNYNAWLNGLYVYDAISKCMYNSFRKETQPAKNYLLEPYDFSKSKEDYEQEERLRMEKQIKEQNERIKNMLKNKK